MIAAIGAYIENIIGLMIVTTFAEAIMPEGSFKKYIRLVTGLVIVAAIVDPAIKLIYGKGFEFELKEVYAFDEDVIKAQQDVVNGIYIEEIEKICTDEAESFGVTIDNIRSEENNGLIENIVIDINKPHTCVENVAYYNGEREECRKCKETEDSFEEELKKATGILNINVNILKDSR